MVITVGYPHPRKVILAKNKTTKYCENKNFRIYGMYLIVRFYHAIRKETAHKFNSNQ